MHSCRIPRLVRQGLHAYSLTCTVMCMYSLTNTVYFINTKQHLVIVGQQLSENRGCVGMGMYIGANTFMQAEKLVFLVP